MVMCLERGLEIEDLRNHSQEMIMQLRYALAGGSMGTPDPKWTGFYEEKRREQLFYIYISPDTGKVLLIAAWPHEEALVCEAGASA